MNFLPMDDFGRKLDGDEAHGVSQEQSLAHYWSLLAMQQRHQEISKLIHEGSTIDDRHFIRVSEFLYWARVVDEGFERILGKPYKVIRSQSVDGRYVEAIALARNKAAHSLVNVIASQEDRLDIDFRLDYSPLGPYLRWVKLEEIISSAMDYQTDPRREALYSELLEGKIISVGLDACWQWLSEVRYDYRNSEWAKSWIADHQLPFKGVNE